MSAPVPMAEDDLGEVLALINVWVPHVNQLDHAALARLWRATATALVVREAPGGELLGAAVVLGPGGDYDSPNYRFFADGEADFHYLDRIVVAAGRHRSGIGRALYREVFARARRAGARRVTCEVNLDPPNPGSLAFHRSLGFEVIAEQVNDGGSTRVALMSADAHADADTDA